MPRFSQRVTLSLADTLVVSENDLTHRVSLVISQIEHLLVTLHWNFSKTGAGGVFLNFLSNSSPNIKKLFFKFNNITATMQFFYLVTIKFILFWISPTYDTIVTICVWIISVECLSVYSGNNFWTTHTEPRNFILSILMHLYLFQVKFEYQGHWVKVNIKYAKT